MERHEILEAMNELKLYGMRASFDEIAGRGLARRDELYPLIASLIRAERIHRQARSISYRIAAARFPVLKDIDTFVFADTPVDEGLVRELASGAFLDAKRNAILLAERALARPICALLWHQPSFAHAPGAASSTSSIWSISWSRKRPLVVAAVCAKICCATI